MSGKFQYILLILCLLSFTSCSNNTLTENTEKITGYSANMKGTDVTEIPNEEDVESSEIVTTQATEITLSEMPLSDVDFTQFKSMMGTDDYAALENYFPVLNGDLAFNYQGWTDETDNMKINLNELCESDMLVELHMFTILDLDNDCIKELILCFDNVGEQLIFHKENDDFFAKGLPYRGFKMLQTNGVYNSSGGAACSHYNKLLFENGEFVEQELGHACTYEDEVYVVNGNSVSEEEFQQWKEEIMIGDVEWYYP